MSLGSCRRLHVPCGLLGMLALMAVIEAVATRVETCSLDFRSTGRAARAEAARSEIVFLGDSQVKMGIAPRVIARRLGRPAFNLAIVGGQPPSTYFLLRRALNAGARPRGIVVNAFPLLMVAGTRINEPMWPELLTPVEALDLSWTARDPILFGRIVVGMLPTLRARSAVRGRLVAALAGEEDPALVEALAARRNGEANLGALIRPRNPGFVDDLSAFRDRAVPKMRGFSRVNRAYVGRLLDLADRRGIPVYWLLAPHSPAWQQDCDRRDVDAPIVDYLRALQKAHPALVVLDARHSGYVREVFIDAAHLDRQGAAILSADVADALADDLSNRRDSSLRWRALPPYRDRDVGVAIEDTDQSKQVVRLALDDRRREVSR